MNHKIAYYYYNKKHILNNSKTYISKIETFKPSTHNYY